MYSSRIRFPGVSPVSYRGPSFRTSSPSGDLVLDAIRLQVSHLMSCPSSAVEFDSIRHTDSVLVYIFTCSIPTYFGSVSVPFWVEVNQTLRAVYA